MEIIALDPVSILVTIIYVAILYLFLSKVFFGPVTRVLAERRAAIEGRLEEAARRIEEVEKKTAEYEAALNEARSAAYRHQETVRSEALEHQARILAEARHEADNIVEQARARLSEESALARASLEKEIDQLANRLSETILQD